MDNNMLKLIFSRRSVRSYREEKVPRERITTLLKAAMSAPSACNQQPWSFVVIEDREALAALSQIHGGYTTMNRSPLVILVCGDPQAAVLRQYWEHDCAAATENIILAAQAVGLGAVWMGVTQAAERDMEIIRNTLHIPQEIVPFSFVSLGYPEEPPEPADRFDEGRVHYNSVW